MHQTHHDFELEKKIKLETMCRILFCFYKFHLTIYVVVEDFQIQSF